MKIIDFERKGNVVRFYLGADDLTEYYGDDWDDYPYDCNAGRVYDEYVKEHIDIAFPFDWLVLEPSNSYGDHNNLCKEDLVARVAPCIIVIPPRVYGESFWWDDFFHWVGADGILKYYYGDHFELDETTKMEKYGGTFLRRGLGA